MPGTPHGNAQWADEFHLQDAGFNFGDSPQSEGLILGKFPRIPQGCVNPMHQAMYDGVRYSSCRGSKYLSTRGDGHLITVAPTRAGKGTGLIIPNLLNYQDSVVVIDPKGENYELTADYRVDVLNQKCWCLDPFCLKKKKSMHGIATLKRVKSMYDAFGADSYAAPTELLAEVSRIAEAIVVRERSERDAFFNDVAQTIIKDAILIVLYLKEKSVSPPISEVPLVIKQTELIDALAENRGRTLDASQAKYALILEAAQEIRDCLTNKDVLINTLRQVEFLQDEGVKAVLDGNPRRCESVLDPEDVSGDAAQSIYIIVPPQHLFRQSRFLRLVMTLFLDTIMRRPTVGGSFRGGRRVLFVLDEIAQLGYLDLIQKAVALAAGYGMTLWMFWQDLSQLKGIYPNDWETFLSNAKIQQFFGCNDSVTAKYISERTGPRTQYSYSEVDGWGMQGLRGNINSSVTTSKIGSELVRPSEVMRADSNIIFNFRQGTFPFLCERMRYYDESSFKGRFASRMKG